MKTKEHTSLRLEPAPEIPGLRFRHFQGEEDFAHMAEIFNQARAADQILETTSAEELAHFYAHNSRRDPYQDVLIAEVNGTPVAYSRVRWDDEQNGPLRYFSGGSLLPEWRRKGIGTAMLAHSEARLREIASEHSPERQKVIDLAVSDTEAGAMALAENNGYKEERYFFFMLRPLDQPIPEAKLPEGLEIRPTTDERTRQIWEAKNEAFRDHWGHVEGTEEDYQHYITHPTTDPTLWKVAWEGDQVAGMVLNAVYKDENERLGVRRGFTDPICTRRPWRRRGLARALILESLHMFKAMGFAHAALGVDTHNPNGALKLYEGCGYQVEERWIVYRKPMN